MTKEQRQFHKRMNDEISGHLDYLFHDFDIQAADRKPDQADWQILRSELKGLLLKAYTRNHHWIAD